MASLTNSPTMEAQELKIRLEEITETQQLVLNEIDTYSVEDLTEFVVEQNPHEIWEWIRRVADHFDKFKRVISKFLRRPPTGVEDAEIA